MDSFNNSIADVTIPCAVGKILTSFAVQQHAALVELEQTRQT